MDEAPLAEDLRELVEELRAKQILVVYLDCAEYMDKTWEIPNFIGYAAGTDHWPYDEEHEPNWVRWWDDLLSLGSRSTGLVIILDNASPLFNAHRKFMTNLLENFLHGQRSWFKREVPYHLCFQMANCSVVKAVFGGTQNSDA